ncbi:hypothetical protein C0991_000890 [Blastosporella zonata]|nr:hypothetical protein C0991_000890 [Blastosporella zonata]
MFAKSFPCPYCLSTKFPTSEAVRRHQGQSKKCQQARQRNLQRLIAESQGAASQTLQQDPLPAPFSGPDDMEVDLGVENTPMDGLDAVIEPEEPGSRDSDACPPSRHTTVEDVEDDGEVWVESFPSTKQAGATFGTAQTSFDTIRDNQILQGAEVLGPFESEEEWELAKWLIKNVGHNQTDQFLQLPIDKFLDAIDSLPGGVSWNLERIMLTGDLMDENGKALTDELELWYRDPVECVQELISNPVFREIIKFAPERRYCDAEGSEQRIDEMWTAAWWWKIQEMLPEGATIAPVILSSDKTRLSQFRGDKSAWPVYLTIGNISKDVCREASSHATVLIGYLPVGKFNCFSEKAKQFERYRTFHHCMGVILDSLVKAGKEGCHMDCADGLIRWIWPVVAAYIADYPEQCLVACCMENCCPICKVQPVDRGSHEPAPWRERQETIELLGKNNVGANDADAKTKFTHQGLRPIFPPFWAKLPFTNIFSSFTPDLLHQLHKGVFKDHLVRWCTNLISEREMDARFKSMPPHPGLRHFKNGISGVSQWTGAEHKAMERVFLGIMAGAMPDGHVTQAVRAISDFIFYSSLQSHTTTTLAALGCALDNFHACKDVFVELEARSPGHFNIPKIHAMEHYVDLIQLFGSADGFNTELPERLHIDYAKNAYRASSKKDYIIQMTNWLRRQEAVDRFTLYLDWVRNGRIQANQDQLCYHQLQQAALEVEDETVVMLAPTPGTNQAYRIAKHHPPGLRGIPASIIVTDHGATRFLKTVTSFLRNHGSPITPQPFDGFDLFKRLSFILPVIPKASAKDLKNIVHATPPVPPRGRLLHEPAHLDLALVRTGERNDKTKGTALEGVYIIVLLEATAKN